MNKIFLLLIFLCTSTFAVNTGTIRGVITDSLTNDPLVGANIIVQGT